MEGIEEHVSVAMVLLRVKPLEEWMRDCRQAKMAMDRHLQSFQRNAPIHTTPISTRAPLAETKDRVYQADSAKTLAMQDQNQSSNLSHVTQSEVIFSRGERPPTYTSPRTNRIHTSTPSWLTGSQEIPRTTNSSLRKEDPPSSRAAEHLVTGGTASRSTPPLAPMDLASVSGGLPPKASSDTFEISPRTASLSLRQTRITGERGKDGESDLMKRCREIMSSSDRKKLPNQGNDQARLQESNTK